MMSKQAIVDNIVKLARISIDAFNANEGAKFDDQEVQARFESVQESIRRHILMLDEIVRALGEKGPELSTTEKRFSIEGFTRVAASSKKPNDALRDIVRNQELVTSCFREASAWDVPEETRDVLLDCMNDSRRHLDEFGQLLTQRAA